MLLERELWRFRRMKHDDARRDFAASVAGLRGVLSRYLGCHPKEVRMERRERGKPYVAGGPEFNLSHTASQVILAVAGEPVGLDVERIDRPVRGEALAAKFFSPHERSAIASLPQSARNAAFLRHWVCKEATVKLSGDGIYRGLRLAEVTFGPDGAAGKYRSRPVALQLFSPAEGFVAALASWSPVRIERRL